MKFLRNFDSANQYLDLELNKVSADNAIRNIAGWYKFIEGKTSALVVSDNKLYFLLDNDSYVINNNYIVKLKTYEATNRLFQLYEAENLILQFAYKVERSYSNISPFEYIDDEDFDWGYFVSNIINDNVRRKNFIDNLMEN